MRSLRSDGPRLHAAARASANLEARHNRRGQALNGRRISWRQMSVLPRREPLADAADRERRDRQTVTRRLEADQRERLRPEAGQNHQIGPREQAVDLGAADPARELDLDATVPADPRRERRPLRALRTVAGKREVHRAAKPLHHLRQRFEQLAAALEFVHAADEEQTPRSSCRPPWPSSPTDRARCDVRGRSRP